MNYTQRIDISYTDIAKQLSESETSQLTAFLREFAAELSPKLEEDNIIAFLPEDIFRQEIAASITQGIANAQEKLKNAARIAFHQPTHDEIEAKIEDLKRRHAETFVKEAAAAKAALEEPLSDLHPDKQILAEDVDKVPVMGNDKPDVSMKSRVNLQKGYVPTVFSRAAQIARTTDILVENTRRLLDWEEKDRVNGASK